jgi:hypothetical protein
MLDSQQQLQLPLLHLQQLHWLAEAAAAVAQAAAAAAAG